MKLRNKHTGEIIEVNGGAINIFYGEDDWITVTSLNQLAETWEDHKESFWYVFGTSVMECDKEEPVVAERMKEIGNYFGTKEEAEKAVEKLKAWKILKDKGFRFIEYELDDKTVADGKIWFDLGVNTPYRCDQLLARKEVKDAMCLLFGGEE